MRALLLILAVAGCESDPCDAFPGETCLSLEVRAGSVEVATLDQIHVAATSGFLLSDGITPATPRRFQLPVRLAVLPGKDYAGPFSLLVRGFLDGTERGRGEVHGDVRVHQHLGLVATLFENGVVPPDLAGADLFGFDLAGADLSIDKLHDLSVGTVWTVQQKDFPQVLQGVWASGPNDIYAVGGSPTAPVVLHSTGDGKWAMQSDPSHVTDTAHSQVWGSAANDVWVLDEYTTTIMHSAGDGNWSLIGDAGITFSGWLGVWGFSSNNFYVVGNGIMHWKGSQFAQENSFSNANDVFGVRPDDVWVAGGNNSRGFMLHSVGDGGWDSQQVPGVDDLESVWSSASNDIYAVGYAPTQVGGSQGVIVHSTGDGSWQKQSGDGLPLMTGVWGFSSSDIYAVGYNGIILHSTGNGVWTMETSQTTENLYDIFGVSAGDIFAVGANGTILHKP